MSIESARALIDRIHVDEEFASRLRVCPNAQARMAFVKSAGLELTDDELGSITAGLIRLTPVGISDADDHPSRTTPPRR